MVKLLAIAEQKMSDEPMVISVPEAGKRLGISRASAFAAASRGEIPTIRIGRLLKVPTRALEQMLERATAKSAA